MVVLNTNKLIALIIICSLFCIPLTCKRRDKCVTHKQNYQSNSLIEKESDVINKETLGNNYNKVVEILTLIKEGKSKELREDLSNLLKIFNSYDLAVNIVITNKGGAVFFYMLEMDSELGRLLKSVQKPLCNFIIGQYWSKGSFTDSEKALLHRLSYLPTIPYLIQSVKLYGDYFAGYILSNVTQSFHHYPPLLIRGDIWKKRVLAERKNAIKEWEKWWDDNKDYIYWGEKECKFKIDEQARRNKTPIDVDTKKLLTKEQIQKRRQEEEELEKRFRSQSATKDKDSEFLK